MADKFLSREDGKQKILGIDLARVETKDGERAVVVTAEIDRFTVFWTKADGSWSQLSRKHDPLEAKPSAPVAPRGSAGRAARKALPFGQRYSFFCLSKVKSLREKVPSSRLAPIPGCVG